MKKYFNISKYIAVIFSVFLLLFGCTSSANSKLSMDEYDLNEIIANAMYEGEVNSLSMPTGWANWDETWDDIRLFYGINHTDTDLYSAEVIKQFADSSENGPDIGDVGLLYAKEAEKQKLTMKFKTTFWDEIPSWAKDDDGDWVVCYTGSIAFLINNDIVTKAPTSWQELLDGDYKVGLTYVSESMMGQYAVYAAAIAMGGDENNIEPGIQLFKTLAEQGRLVYGMNNLDDYINNDIGVQIKWDYVALNYRDMGQELKKPVHLSACIPSDGSVTAEYASVINKNAAHPFAAALAREYILSDAGQLNLVKGYATPVRSVRIPDDIAAKRIPSSQYNDKMIENSQKFSHKAYDEILEHWNKEVMPVLKGK